MEPLIKTENKTKTQSPKDGSRCNRHTSQTQSVKINGEREGRPAEGREGGWRGLKEGNQRGRGRMGERSSSPLLVGAEGEQRAVPFFSMSRCSHRMSPTKGGQRLVNSSRSILHSCEPFTVHMLTSMPCRLSSADDQASHCCTCTGLHWAGSASHNTPHSTRCHNTPRSTRCHNTPHSTRCHNTPHSTHSHSSGV